MALEKYKEENHQYAGKIQFLENKVSYYDYYL
jgi:hypothetical protein